jgi:hypothetical protein
MVPLPIRARESDDGDVSVFGGRALIPRPVARATPAPRARQPAATALPSGRRLP